MSADPETLWVYLCCCSCLQHYDLLESICDDDVDDEVVDDVMSVSQPVVIDLLGYTLHDLK